MKGMRNKNKVLPLPPVVINDVHSPDKERNNIATSEASKSRQALDSSRSSDNKIKLDNYVFVAVLGKGSYGKVFLVQRKDSDKLYAMKIMAKNNIFRRKNIGRVLQERKLLSQFTHPLVNRLHSSFQTRQKVFLILDFCSGGELKYHLRQQGGKFEIETAVFYMAQICIALKYIHELNVIFRDLKSENLLLDGKGNISLSDFGLAHTGVSGWLEGAHTMCGTPHYMAPEVIARNSYGQSCDYWSAGVTFYEMKVSLTPYRGDNAQDVFNNIFNLPLRLARSWPEDIKDFVRKILYKIPESRLGADDGGAEILAHPMFSRVDMGAIGAFTAPAPITPMSVAVDHTQSRPQNLSNAVWKDSYVDSSHILCSSERGESNHSAGAEAKVEIGGGGGGGGDRDRDVGGREIAPYLSSNPDIVTRSTYLGGGVELVDGTGSVHLNVDGRKSSTRLSLINQLRSVVESNQNRVRLPFKFVKEAEQEGYKGGYRPTHKVGTPPPGAARNGKGNGNGATTAHRREGGRPPPAPHTHQGQGQLVLNLSQSVSIGSKQYFSEFSCLSADSAISVARRVKVNMKKSVPREYGGVVVGGGGGGGGGWSMSRGGNTDGGSILGASLNFLAEGIQEVDERLEVAEVQEKDEQEDYAAAKAATNGGATAAMLMAK